MEDRKIRKEPNEKKEGRFAGIFSAEDRKNLRDRRRALRLSHEKLADILEVKWETVRNWENGRNIQCRTIHVPLVKRFLAGELDEQIAERQEYEMLKSFLRKGLTKSMLRYFEWSLEICRKQPETGQGLLEELRRLVTREIIRHMEEMSKG